jgi:CDP-diacylglycerol--glycerol-3-phosphate 3-phosphatidyltransferase
MIALRDTAERNRVWTISNFLSFSRLLFLIPALYYLHQNTPRGNWIATGFLLLSCATDWWDGFLARKLRQQSELGRIIDPLMDKIGVGAVAVYLTLFRDFPVWFLLLILSRDFIIITFGLLMTSRQHKVPESNWYGKVTVSAMAIVLLTFVLDVQAVKWPFFWTMVCIFFISIAGYAQRFAMEIKR